MDAVKFLKEKNRMTKNCKVWCKDCSLQIKDDDGDCMLYNKDSSEKAVEIVETWSKENPVRSYYDVMIEVFPKIDFNEITCIDEFLGTDTDCNGDGCEKCWKAREYTKPTTK